MIARVGAALSQLIKPIASSTSQAGPKPTPEFERYRAPKDEQPSQREQKPKSAQVIPFPKKEDPPKPAPSASVTHSFILLLSHFQQQRTWLFRWFGTRAYQKASGDRRNLGKYRKGAMLDRKAE